MPIDRHLADIQYQTWLERIDHATAAGAALLVIAALVLLLA